MKIQTEKICYQTAVFIYNILKENYCCLQKPIVGPNELFYFADVCAGPGGFSEYVLWRKKKGEAKGFGFTLKGPCDFKLENFFAAPSEMFDPYYGKSLVKKYIYIFCFYKCGNC